MTPQQKANELIEKFFTMTWKSENNHCIILADSMPSDKAYECALVVVNEVLSVTPMYIGAPNPKWAFYAEVKKILEKR